MKVFITGGAGFLGINLVRALRARGVEDVAVYDIADFDYPEKGEVRCFRNDVRDYETLRDAMKGYDMVVHTAAALPLYTIEEIRSTDVDGNTTESTALSYTAYSIENDVLYMAVVEEHDPMFTTNQTALVSMFKADSSGSADKAVAKNPIALSCLNGTWEREKGSLTIQDGAVTSNGESGKLSFDDSNRLVVELDGKTTAYGMSVTILKDYGENTETNVLALSYTGADENDRPNLLPVLDDWKTDYGWDTWYYTGSFKLQ